jgi:hypothetical protein
VDMLTSQHKKLLKEVVKRKYNIEVSSSQIVNLIASKFDCSLNILDTDSNPSDSKVVFIKGNVNQYRTLPLRVDFWCPKHSRERLAFEKRLNMSLHDAQHLDFYFKCEIISNGHIVKQNQFQLDSRQLTELGIVDEIFGPADSAYVTRNQASKLSSSIYSVFKVDETYQIPESQFNSLFIDDLILKTSSTLFKNANFDSAFELISKYSTDLSSDLLPSTIKDKMSNVFTINEFNNKSRITINDKRDDSGKESSSPAGEGKLGGNFLGMLGLDACIKFVNTKSNEWNKSAQSLNEQVGDLNSVSGSDIEWHVVGNEIVPKSLKVSLMKKASFTQNFTFNRIRREIYEAPFKREFSLYLWRSLKSPAIITETMDEIKRLDAEQRSLLNSFNQFNESCTETSAQNYKNMQNNFEEVHRKFDDLRGVQFSFNNSLAMLEKILSETKPSAKLKHPDFLIDSGYWNLANLRSKTSHNETVHYKVSFKNQPALIWHVVQLDEWLKTSHAFVIEAEQHSSAKSFTFFLESWSNTNIVEIRVRWVAFGF